MYKKSTVAGVGAQKSDFNLRVLVTGGAGFIGSHLILNLSERAGVKICNLDKLTYAADLEPLKSVSGRSTYIHKKVDIADASAVRDAFTEFNPDIVFHLAAESHVDRSIASAYEFIETNVIGTFNILQAFRGLWEFRGREPQMKLIHVSTDEVYGSLNALDPVFTEDSPYLPNSPYSASKASSDHLARAWFQTYGLPIITTHCSNNYGPHQFPEKLIPVIIKAAISGQQLPVYGEGKNIRDWIFVEDHIAGLIAAWEKGQLGEVYNFGGKTELSNLQLVIKICKILDLLLPKRNGHYEEQVAFINDRLGHDFRYGVSIIKAERHLNWAPKVNLDIGLENTIRWYLGRFQ